VINFVFMQLPDELKNKLDELSLNVSLAEWTRAFHHLSQLYRDESRGREIGRLSSDRLREAYVHVRLPATYAAVVQVLEEVKRRAPDVVIETMADVGSGPGTGVFAAADVFSTLKRVVCYERDSGFIALARRLSEYLGHLAKQWVQADVTRECALKQEDLVLASYALGELDPKERSAVVGSLWNGTGKVLVIVEPGTPHGFEVIRAVRQELIGLGGKIIAPCPHMNPCPMAKGDWCHFSARVERSSLHRQIKGGALNYEDEKFSYVVAACEPGIPIEGRILRHPQKNSGFVIVEVCSGSGIKQMTVTRKSKDDYRRMRKAEWGDSF
jgi:ribosomal protein RSM22 (predicted rRNA methylase)